MHISSATNDRITWHIPRRLTKNIDASNTDPILKALSECKCSRLTSYSAFLATGALSHRRYSRPSPQVCIASEIRPWGRPVLTPGRGSALWNLPVPTAGRGSAFRLWNRPFSTAGRGSAIRVRNRPFSKLVGG